MNNMKKTQWWVATALTVGLAGTAAAQGLAGGVGLNAGGGLGVQAPVAGATLGGGLGGAGSFDTESGAVGSLGAHSQGSTRLKAPKTPSIGDTAGAAGNAAAGTVGSVKGAAAASSNAISNAAVGDASAGAQAAMTTLASSKATTGGTSPAPTQLQPIGASSSDSETAPEASGKARAAASGKAAARADTGKPSATKAQ